MTEGEKSLGRGKTGYWVERQGWVGAEKWLGRKRK